MQIWAESGKSALPICNYSQILYQFLTFTQNLKRSLVCTVFLFIYAVTDLCMDSYICLALRYECSRKICDLRIGSYLFLKLQKSPLVSS